MGWIVVLAVTLIAALYLQTRSPWFALPMPHWRWWPIHTYAPVRTFPNNRRPSTPLRAASTLPTVPSTALAASLHGTDDTPIWSTDAALWIEHRSMVVSILGGTQSTTWTDADLALAVRDHSQLRDWPATLFGTSRPLRDVFPCAAFTVRTWQLPKEPWYRTRTGTLVRLRRAAITDAPQWHNQVPTIDASNAAAWRRASVDDVQRALDQWRAVQPNAISGIHDEPTLEWWIEPTTSLLLLATPLNDTHVFLNAVECWANAASRDFALEGQAIQQWIRQRAVQQRTLLTVSARLAGSVWPHAVTAFDVAASDASEWWYCISVDLPVHWPPTNCLWTIAGQTQFK